MSICWNNETTWGDDFAPFCGKIYLRGGTQKKVHPLKPGNLRLGKKMSEMMLMNEAHKIKYVPNTSTYSMTEKKKR